MQSSLFDTVPARATDPDTSVLAATETRAYNGALVTAIRAACAARAVPLAQVEIASIVHKTHGDRWKTSTIVTACARAGLVRVGTTTIDGRPHATWTI